MWQTVAMWLVVGAVVIWIAAGLIRRRIFKDKSGNNGKSGKSGKSGNNGNNQKPPCCG